MNVVMPRESQLWLKGDCVIVIIITRLVLLEFTWS